MRTTSTLALLSSVFAVTEAVTGQLGDAQAVLNNPAGARYEAVLPQNSFNPFGIRGYIAASTDNATGGVRFNVQFSNLPSVGMPFMYHIHVAPVPSNGNCTATLAHQDPYIRGEDVPCDPSAPATCQTGDLSGKYGNITTTSYNATYVDPYASLVEGLGSFFGNRSFVFHFANKTRIGCANFTRVTATNATIPTNNASTTALPSVTAGGISGAVSTAGGATGATGTARPTTTTFPGAAPQIAVGGSVVLSLAGLVGIFAFVF